MLAITASHVLEGFMNIGQLMMRSLLTSATFSGTSVRTLKRAGDAKRCGRSPNQQDRLFDPCLRPTLINPI